MFDSLTTRGKIVLVAILFAVLMGGFYLVQRSGVFQPPAKEAVVPDLAPLSGIPVDVSDGPTTVKNGALYRDGCELTALMIPWNGTMPIHLANGGVKTVEGSMMAKRGVRLHLQRQDDYSVMTDAMIEFARGIKNGEDCPRSGAAFSIIMGDAYSGFAAGATETLSKLGQGIEGFYALGYSYGEDKCMLPAGFDEDPQKARGSLIGAVMRDGGYNICVTWAAQNGIPINPDTTTYDPNAINFRAVSSFTEADNGVIVGYQETRAVVENGKRTGERREVTQNGTATWTPGDVKVAREVGGYVPVASTREYSYQMPALVIGNKEFMARNSDLIVDMIRAFDEAGNAIKSSDSALRQAADIEAQVFGEQDGAYWAKYARGVVERDKRGLMVSLGGSRVNNIADNAFLFGLDGNDALFKRNYDMFGTHNATYYPEVTPNYPDYYNVVNTEYLAAALSSASPGETAPAETLVAYNSAPIEDVVAQRNWSIEFDTGKATIRPESVATLDEMLNQIAITSLQVEIRGHTDATGTDSVNLPLSRARAEAVKTYLMAAASSSFPEGRIVAKGFGSMKPVADNSTRAGRQQNRRVEVILGTSGR